MHLYPNGNGDSFSSPDISYPSSLSTAFSSDPGDRGTAPDFEDALPTTEVSSGISLPCHHPTIFSSQDSLGSLTSVHMMSAAHTPSTGHVPFVEHGFEREARRPLRHQFSEAYKTYTPDCYLNPLDSLVTSEEAMIEVQPDPAVYSQGLPEFIQEWPCSFAQDPCAYFASTELPTNSATSGTATVTDPTLSHDPNGYHGQSYSKPRESSGICEPFTPFLRLPALADGYSVEDGTSLDFRINSTSEGWQCPHPSCTSKTIFTRQRDFDKHYRLHFPRFACRVPSCHLDDGKPRMFALRKDRDRHEAAHNPSLYCNFCGGIFSRRDNLRDHCRKVHERLI